MRSFPAKKAGASEGVAEACEGPEFELPLKGFAGTPEEIEQQWYDQVYKGRGDSILQLTWRAILMGSVLGGVSICDT